MTEQEMKMKLEKLGFRKVWEKHSHTLDELTSLKAEGAAIPENDNAALVRFTEKWNAFVNNPENSFWKLIDEDGYRKGIWA